MSFSCFLGIQLGDLHSSGSRKDCRLRMAMDSSNRIIHFSKICFQIDQMEVFRKINAAVAPAWLNYSGISVREYNTANSASSACSLTRHPFLRS